MTDDGHDTKLCECGCGRATSLATMTDRRSGAIKGQPVRFIYGHYRTPVQVESRFWAKVDKGGPTPLARPDLGPCWQWLACVDPKGYGRFQGLGPSALPHRISYELLVGPIPEGLHIDHLCKNRSCVNPDHLEAVTPAENSRRSPNQHANKTHCIHGHEFTPENTYRSPAGARQCRTCHLASARRRYAERRAAA